MPSIAPKVAAALATEIYETQAEAGLKLFLRNRIFSQKPSDTQHLKAEVGFRIINALDGFGLCARGGAGYENDLFIMFRGTTTKNYGADIISDLRLGVEKSATGLPVHIGFNHAFSSMIPTIDEFLTSHADALGTVHVIGHSLGGAVASLAAEWLSARRKNIKLYTFGCPKPGLEFFADKLTQKLGADNIYRVYHATDVVPMVPVFPFTHSPTSHCGYQLPSSSFISLAAHKMVNYEKSVTTASWAELKSTGEKTADANSIERWLKSDAPVNPADPKTWEWLNAGLVWVLRKIIGNAAVVMQGPIMSSASLADKIAWILHKGFDLTLEAGGWVLSLMRKIMLALGMKVAKTAAELTQAFMRNILQQLIARMSAEAMRAIRGLIVKS